MIAAVRRGGCGTPQQLRRVDLDAILRRLSSAAGGLSRTGIVNRHRLPYLLLLTTLLLTGCVGAQNRPMQLIAGSGPSYPAEAKAAGIEGEVVVRYDVSVTGAVENARVERASPAGVFEEAALAAVRSWRYNPRIREGQAEAVQDVLSTVRFRLSGADVDDRY